jgi:TetR/AcrR family transcriptional regulator, cholesterol catabolism regulator
MSRAGGSDTRDLETAARRERMMEAATELAAVGGYDAVQMRDVAARAEVALGTLYRHYPSKDHLLLTTLAEQAEALRERIAQRPPVGPDAADRTADVLRRASRALARRPELTAAMVTALTSPEPDTAGIKHRVEEILRSIITSAIDGADVADPDGIVRVLGYVWLAVLSAWVGGTLDTDQMITDLEVAARLLLGPSPQAGT